LRVKGWPTLVMLRGKTIVQDGRLLGQAGDGAFLKRELAASTAG
jgi:dihydropyrimidinase